LIGLILLFLSLGGFLTLYCKRCLCTCIYGSVLSVFAFLVALVGSVLLAVVLISKTTINSYCAEAWDEIPFGLGDSLQDSGFTPTELDGLLNAPQNILCSDLCPCPPEEEFLFQLWPKNFFTTPRENGELLNLSGSYISFENCINDLLDSNSRDKADKMRKALKMIPLDTLATIQDGRFSAVANLSVSSEIDIDNLPIEKLTTLLGEVVTGVLTSIYRILEDTFECSAICNPSYFYLGSGDITTGPPLRGCIAPFKEYIDFNFGKWGWSLLTATVILYTLLGFTCCLHRKNLFSDVDSKVGFMN
jgi:hypothetical protein